MSTTVREPDGSLTMTSYTAPVNYATADGWEPIDNTLVESSSAGYAVENAANSYTAKIPEDGSGRPVRFSVDAGWISMKMNGLDDTPVVSNEEATFTDVEAAERVTYEAANVGLKESVILDVAPEAGRVPVYTYAIATSPGLTPKLTTAGSVEVTNTAGKVVMSIPRGNMVDSAGSPAYTEDVTYALAPTGTGWMLTMTPDAGWLRDPARVYPVTIDPTITPGAVKDCWINQDSSACGDAGLYIRVGRKAAGDVFRGLLKFDVTSIPVDATVTAATVGLSIDETKTLNANEAAYGFYQAPMDWHYATWTTPQAGATWIGGNPAGSPLGVRNLDGQSGGPKEFTGFGPLVQDWVNGSTVNHGLLVKQVEESVNNFIWFRSSIADTGKPVMSVSYRLAQDLVTESQGLDIVNAVLAAENDVWLAGSSAVVSPRTAVVARAGGPSAALQKALDFAASLRSGVTDYDESIESSTVEGTNFTYSRLDNGDLEVMVTVETRQTYRSGKKATPAASWTDVRKFILPVRGTGRDPFEVTWMPEASADTPGSAGTDLPSSLRTSETRRPAGVSARKTNGQQSYNVQKFVDYALKWTDWTHVYSMNASYPDYRNDCANFASQALDTTWKQTGGTNPNDPQNWDSDLTGPYGASDTWAGAGELFDYAKNQKHLAPMEYIADAQTGDLLFVDWDNDGNTAINHVSLITGMWHGMPRISQKSTNRHNVRWAVWRKIITESSGPDPIFYGLRNLVERS